MVVGGQKAPKITLFPLDPSRFVMVGFTIQDVHGRRKRQQAAIKDRASGNPKHAAPVARPSEGKHTQPAEGCSGDTQQNGRAGQQVQSLLGVLGILPEKLESKKEKLAKRGERGEVGKKGKCRGGCYI